MKIDKEENDIERDVKYMIDFVTGNLTKPKPKRPRPPKRKRISKRRSRR